MPVASGLHPHKKSNRFYVIPSFILQRLSLTKQFTKRLIFQNKIAVILFFYICMLAEFI